MAKRMLIDSTHPEETRVVVLSGNRLEEFDFETSTKRQIKGNIYLAKVTRVEPSLQAAFVEYGGNRHGFLAFSEIHPDYYRIPVGDRLAGAYDEDEEEQADAVPLAPSGAGARSAEAEASTPADSWSEHADDAYGDDDEADDHGADAEASTRDAEAEAHGTMAAEAREPRLTTGPGAGFPGAPRDWESGAAAPTEARGEPTDEIQIGGEVYAAMAPLPVETRPEPEAAVFAPAAEADHSEGERPGPESLETVGGDELEEVAQQRARHRPSFPRHYKIQEVIKRRQIMLVQVTKEERGNKGAALTTYLSLAGRYCVLMPNTGRGGGVSRKITNVADRRRLKDLVGDLDLPEGMGIIVRTAGSERSKAEIKRDYEYLLRLWDEIRELTLKSTAPAMIYEEGNLIKRAIRDLYTRDIDEVIVDGEEGYRTAKAFMKMLMPSHAKRVRLYRDPTIPLLHRFQVESQIDAIHSPVVQLRSGGYIVINPTEALVAIDVNSGRSTRERNIEETALKTNLEAAEEIARQLRLRDLAGLIVIDFIDMEEGRNQGAVERRLKDAMRYDRARIQLGRISPFGLLELSRQRLRPSLLEASTQPCPHCNGTGNVRSTESTALHVLRAIEEEGMRRRSAEISVAVPSAVALYVLNQKRAALVQAETRYGFRVTLTSDDTLIPPAFRLDRLRALTPAEIAALPAPVAQLSPLEPDEAEAEETEIEAEAEEEEEEEEEVEASGTEDRSEQAEGEDGHGRRRRRRRRRRRPDDRGEERASERHAEEREQHHPGETRDDEPRGDEPQVEELPQAIAAPSWTVSPADVSDRAAASPEEEMPEEMAAGSGGAEGDGEAQAEFHAGDEEGDGPAGRRRRRRGRRGGRRRSRPEEAPREGMVGAEPAESGAARGPWPEEDLSGDVTPLGAMHGDLMPGDMMPGAVGPEGQAPAHIATSGQWVAAEGHEGHGAAIAAETVEVLPPTAIEAPRDGDDEHGTIAPPASIGVDLVPIADAGEAATASANGREPPGPASTESDRTEAEPSAAPAVPEAPAEAPAQESPTGPAAHTITERPVNPRRGWWQRLLQP